jgi:retinol-binding protein 3
VKDGEKFAALLTTHLQEVSHDKHLRLNFSAVRYPADPGTPSPQQAAETRRMTERNNCGFEKVELLAGNVGYVKFNVFVEPALCAPTAIAAMNFLANVDAIVFDLRDNRGGDPAMVALISTYLFDQPTHLNDIWDRKTGATQQYWTLSTVPGKRLAAVPAFVLTSSRTFSGAEEFSYNLKTLKRATLVGETTGGGAHPVQGERIDDRFLIGVPHARAINPITSTNWELGRYWSRARREGRRGRRPGDCPKAGGRSAGKERICCQRHELIRLGHADARARLFSQSPDRGL